MTHGHGFEINAHSPQSFNGKEPAATIPISTAAIAKDWIWYFMVVMLICWTYTVAAGAKLIEIRLSRLLVAEENKNEESQPPWPLVNFRAGFYVSDQVDEGRGFSIP